jgi:hypothetical protein
MSFLFIEQLDQFVSQLDERKAMTDMTTSPSLAGTQRVPGSVGNTVSVWCSILWAIPTRDLRLRLDVPGAQLPIAGVLI